MNKEKENNHNHSLVYGYPRRENTQPAAYARGSNWSSNALPSSNSSSQQSVAQNYMA